MRSYSDRSLHEIGIHERFVEDNYVVSKRGSVRGLHYQLENPESKLIRCVKGRILDITVDLRVDSTTYKGVFKVELTEADNRLLFVPGGFAHGFVSLMDSVVFYKSSNYYFSEDQHGISIYSKKIQLDRILEKEGIQNIIITEKDRALLNLENL
jgi:dTDP-4-dehydrorhamnose 3,5-epimerase